MDHALRRRQWLRLFNVLVSCSKNGGFFMNRYCGSCGTYLNFHEIAFEPGQGISTCEQTQDISACPVS